MPRRLYDFSQHRLLADPPLTGYLHWIGQWPPLYSSTSSGFNLLQETESFGVWDYSNWQCIWGFDLPIHGSSATLDNWLWLDRQSHGACSTGHSMPCKLSLEAEGSTKAIRFCGRLGIVQGEALCLLCGWSFLGTSPSSSSIIILSRDRSNTNVHLDFLGPLLCILLPRLVCSFAIEPAFLIYRLPQPAARRERRRNDRAFNSKRHRPSVRMHHSSNPGYSDRWHMHAGLASRVHCRRTVWMGQHLRNRGWCLSEPVPTGLVGFNDRCAKDGRQDGHGVYVE